MRRDELIEERVNGLCRSMCSDPPPGPFIFLPEARVVMELAPGGRDEKVEAAQKWLVLTCWADDLVPRGATSRRLFGGLGSAELQVVGDAVSELEHVGSEMVQELIGMFAAETLHQPHHRDDCSLYGTLCSRLAERAHDAYCVVLPAPTRETEVAHGAPDTWIVCTKVRGQIAQLRRVDPCCNWGPERRCTCYVPGQRLVH